MHEKSFKNSIAPIDKTPSLSREQLASWLVMVARGAGLALVAIIPLIVAPFASDAYNHPKVLALYGLTLTIVVAWAGSYMLLRRPQWKITLAEIPLWLFVFVALVSSWVSVEPRLTFFGAPTRYEGLLAILAYCALYFAGVHIFGSEREFRSLATVAGGIAVLTMGYGLTRLFLPPLFPNEVMLKELYATLGYRRAFSTLGNPVTFGGYLALMLPLLGGLALVSSGRSRLLWWSALGLGYLTLFVTFTRAAWLAALTGTGVFMVAAGFRMFRVQRRAAIAVIVIALAGVGLTRAVVSSGQLADRIRSGFEGSGSVAQRLYIWGRTIDAIRARPALGWGLETLRDVFPYDRAGLVKHFGLPPIMIDEAHNDLLQMAVSIGIPGAVLYLVFWVCVIIAAVRVCRRSSGAARFIAAGWLGALVSYFVQAQFSYSTVAIAPIVWLLAGSVGGWEAQTDRE
jgi:O-antigen ligase